MKYLYTILTGVTALLAVILSALYINNQDLSWTLCMLNGGIGGFITRCVWEMNQ